MSALQLIVLNNTGNSQTYAFFAQSPEVSNAVNKVWSNVLRTQGVENGGEAKMEATKDYYAACGTLAGTPNQGVRVSTAKHDSVTLGTQTKKGTTIRATYRSGILEFEDETVTQEAPVGSFQIRTDSSFTSAIVKQEHIYLGISNEPKGFAAIGTFAPQPSTVYSIRPVQTYYVQAKETSKLGDLVDVDSTGDTFKATFSEQGTTIITCEHQPNGTFKQIYS